ncbi:hypothetical protein SAMN03159341_13220 [Paenibacillus sp. 1_12]|uniref:DUF1643 domain-containing protein n=1 Tax=Paenibacillus sp. 1_12 TaxID=1566278 RepID=UPI0008E58060|nr:DUF1643 domain-containing protein [Paenibacillus sp. 1_12]SFM42081.1 hypothetical protein SAMN03159341_13220 [Paenibacillus sp. 1_12]
MRYKRGQIVGVPLCDKETIVETNEKLIVKREILQIEINKDGDKTVAVIMMNPSEADSIKSDGTVNRVIAFFLKPFQRPLNERNRRIEDIKHLNILNLLPIYNPRSKGLLDDLSTIIAEHYDEYLHLLLESNIQKNLETIRTSDYVVLAWGMPENFPLTLYYKQVSKVLEAVISFDKEIFVFRVRNSKARYHITKHLNPPHPSRCKLLRLVRVDVKLFYRIVPRGFRDEL